MHEHVYTQAPERSGDSTITHPTIVVQVREFPSSAHLEVVAWDLDDPFFGLYATLRRDDGTLLGEPHFGNHELYLTPLYVSDMGGFHHASIDSGPWLQRGGPSADLYACSYGAHCSPSTYVGVWLADSLLRANRDSLVVTFHGASPGNSDWNITLPGELISRYLSTIDSVTTSLRRVAARN